MGKWVGIGLMLIAFSIGWVYGPEINSSLGINCDNLCPVEEKQSDSQ